MGEIIKPGATIGRTLSEWTEININEGQHLVITANGASIADTAVPVGKRWVVHMSIEVHEAPML